MSELSLAPLVHWDGMHLVLNLSMLEQRLWEWARRLDQVRSLTLCGGGDAIRVLATLRWKGVPASVAFELAEIRLRYRFLGFRIRRLRALGGVPVPLSAIEMLVKRRAPGFIHLKGRGIVVVDLRQWLPQEAAVSVLSVQATDRALHIWLGPGELGDLPQAVTPALAAGGEEYPPGGASG